MEILAYGAAEPGGTLHPIHPTIAPPQPNEVLIRVTHCGICHSDIHMIDNDWRSSDYPLVPGHEVIGEVAVLGKDVKLLTLGQRVGLGWQAGSCGSCEWCLGGEENLCRDSVSTIKRRSGGFATHVVADERFAFPIPQGLDSAKSAPLLCGGITVYAPLRRYAVGPGKRVGIMGIGGLGHMALKFAHSMGAQVTALSSTPAKEAEAKDMGAHEFLLSSDPGALKAAKNGLDFLLVTATVDLDWQPYLQLLRPNGVLCFVTGEETRFTTPVSNLLMRQLSVTGSVIGNRAMIQDMLAFADAHDIAAKVETMPAKEVNAALTKVRRNQARYRMVLEL